MPKAVVRGFVGPYESSSAYILRRESHPQTGEMRYRFKVKNFCFVIDSPAPDPWDKDWLVQITASFRKNKRPDGSVDKRNTGIRIKLFPIPDDCKEPEGILEWFTEFAVVLHFCVSDTDLPVRWLGESRDSGSRSEHFLVGVLRY